MTQFTTAAPADITAKRLQLFAPLCDFELIAPYLDKAAKAHGIDTPREVRHWLAQLHHESQGFTRWTENLNWRDPVRLDAMFASVRGVEDAKALIAKGAEAIANRIYAGKAGNGNEASGDGWRFRGRSPIGLTCRGNYLKACAWTGRELMITPDLASGYQIGATIAAAWWRDHGLGEVVAADPGERSAAGAALEAALRACELDDVRAAARVINGGLNGVEDRERQLLRAGTIWRD